MGLRGTLLALLLLGLFSGQAQSIVYCNITDVKCDVLSNGIQVTVASDGILEYQHPTEQWQPRYWSGKSLTLLFPGARSKFGRNFIDVSKFPVSFIQLSIPATAQEGVGILLTVSAMANTEFRISQAADRQSVIITVASTRTLEKGAGSTATVGGEAQLTVESRDGTASVHAVNADVHEVFARVAQTLNLDVAVDDGVDRRVSVFMADVPGEDLLRAIARAAGLALVKTPDGTFMVSAGVVEDLATYRLTETRSFRMHNIQASSAAQLLPTFIFPYLHQNKPQNAVVVTAQGDMLEKIEADLRAIDKAPPQIMIEVLAVEFIDTKEAERSLALLHNTAGSAGTYDSTLGDISYSTIGVLPEEFLVNVNWLKSKGKAVIKAQPKMAVLNGGQARIFIGSTRFIEVEVSQWGSVSRRIQGVNVGVTLEISPWTGESKEITTTIAPTVSNISELDSETGLPVLSTRDAKTQVRALSGETIMIGGLSLEQEQVTTHKTKILGDLPLIGSLFRRKATQRTESLLVIFVTPRLLDERGRLPEAEREAIHKRFLESDHGWQEPATIEVKRSGDRLSWREPPGPASGP